jgi:multidrug efflux pump subunit AcrB
MWIVRLALRRPYTFVVGALLVLLLGIVSILRTPVDIFPTVDIPVISVIWTYNGMLPQEMERQIVTVSERALTTTVNNIEHMESQTVSGVSVIKIFFQPGADIPSAVAQVTALSQTIVRALPPGATPPLIVQFSASNVPVLQQSISSPTIPEDQLNDYANNFIRTQLATVQGASVPAGYGGKPRFINVDLDPQQMFAHNVSASDVSAAINAQNVILPSGTAKMGDREYNVRLNESPTDVDLLNDLPIKQVNGAVVYIRDVAHVRDGAGVQTNIVREDGRRSALLTILKSGSASTLDVVNRVKAIMPQIQATLPNDLNLQFLFDQSLFVRSSISGVVREAIIAACLTAVMILLFLGSWRSTLIVVISIPLSILCSLIVLWAIGQTINIMTLGGLALAVGILVDDATVEIENIHRNLAMGKEIKQAILDGAQQIAVPAFVSTLSICIVFVPVVFLSGVAKSLFTPLAMAVVFAMLASYLLTRTLIPTMVRYLLRSEVRRYQSEAAQTQPGEPETVAQISDLKSQSSTFKSETSEPESNRRPAAESIPKADVIWRVSRRFEQAFERRREGYRNRLAWALSHRFAVCAAFVVFCAGSLALFPFLGRDFFPQVDAGQFRLHVRAPAGTRIEETEFDFQQVEDVIRETVPANQLAMILDNIGLPSAPINLAFSDSPSIGPSEGEILVALNPEHGPTAQYVEQLRTKLRTRFPELTFYFLPADIVSQILNFGLPAPIDIQVVGTDSQNLAIAREIQQRVAKVPGAVDVHLHQIVDYPELLVNVDRTRAEQLGLSQRDVAGDLTVSLSSSGQTAPNFWINPANGVRYTVQARTPQYRIDSVAALRSTPVTSGGQQPPQLLSNLATIDRGTGVAVVSHYNVQPTLDIFAGVQDQDLGSVAGEVNQILADIRPKLPRGTQVVMRGQVQTMNSSFAGLAGGLIFAAVLVYFLIVVNFQSWLDPLIIMMALPGAMSGIIWMLFVTQTTLSVPALMGAIMTVGVATANSILLITFATKQRLQGKTAIEAALSAGYTRLRPVIMTATAMIIGMLPMAFGFGEGGEQNAPLGRAVIGGLLVATFATLFFVPVLYSILQQKQPEPREEVA